MKKLYIYRVTWNSVVTTTHHIYVLPLYMGSNIPHVRGRPVICDRNGAKEKVNETQEQKQLIQWCRTDPRFQYIFHIPNETVGGKGWLIRNRQLGVRSGVPDLFYPVPMNGYHGLFIEMKTDSGRISESQKKWIHALTELGYKVVVARGWEQARDALLDYTGGKS